MNGKIQLALPTGSKTRTIYRENTNDKHLCKLAMFDVKNI